MPLATNRELPKVETRSNLGDGRIPKALLEADYQTLQAALDQKRKEEIQSILEQLRDLDAQRAELNARLVGLGYRTGAPGSVRPRPAGGVRGPRPNLADGSAEMIITEALAESPNERPGYYYGKVIEAGGTQAQARRILMALVKTGKVRVEGVRPHNRYSLA